VAVDGLPWIARLAGGNIARARLAVHLTISVAIGAGYGMLFERESPDWGAAIGWDALWDYLVVCRHVNSVPHLAGSFLHLDHRGGRQRALFTPRASDLRRGHRPHFLLLERRHQDWMRLDRALPARGRASTPCWPPAPLSGFFFALG